MSEKSSRPLRRSSRNVSSTSSSSPGKPLKRKQAAPASESKPKKKSKFAANDEELKAIAQKPKKSLSPKAGKKAKETTSTKASSVTTKSPMAMESISKSKEETKEEDSNGAAAKTNHWLLKAEPESRIEKGKDVKFSIDDLQACTEPEPWSGVRNHVAKNNMLAMKKGDLAFFYHSSCKVPGVVGIMEIVHEATPDLSAFDSKDPYYDPKSDSEKPRWFNVQVEFRKKFDEPNKTSLPILKKLAENGPLATMALVKQSRLSVSKVTSEEWNYILDLAGYTEYKDSK